MTDSLRDTVLEKMPAPLVNKLAEVEKSLESMRTGTMLAYHKLGNTLKMVQDDPDRFRGSDGTDGIDLLMQAVGKHESTLRTALRFSDQYSADDLNVLIELENKKTGFQLIWGHVPILLTVTTKADRKKWAARAVREEMTPKEMHDAMKQEEGRADGHGRPFKIPPTISKQLTAMQRELISLQKKQDTVWNGEGEAHSTFRNIIAIDATEIDDDWLEQLKELRDSFATLQEAVARDITDADACITRIGDVLSAREEEATRDAATAATVASTPSRSTRAVQLDSDDGDEVPTATVRRSTGRRATAAEV